MHALFYFDPEWQVIFGLASAVLGLWAFLPYILDTLRGSTEPERASWLIWSVLSAIAFAAQMQEGASESLGFAAAKVTGTVVVLLLAISRGRGVFLSRPDERALWLAVIGLVLWYMTDRAEYALALTITISLLGGTLTIAKSYQRPESETLSSWTMSFLAACCALAAVGSYDWMLLAYPLYLFVLNGAIICAIVLGRATADRTLARGLPRV